MTKLASGGDHLWVVGSTLVPCAICVPSSLSRRRGTHDACHDAKRNESIVINDDITFIIIDVRQDKVRIGVESPREMPIHRGEVYEVIRNSRVWNEEYSDRRNEWKSNSQHESPAQPRAAYDEPENSQEVRNPSREDASWQGKVADGWRTIRSWFNRLVDGTIAPAYEKPTELAERDHSALTRTEPMQTLKVESSSTNVKVVEAGVTTPIVAVARGREGTAETSAPSSVDQTSSSQGSDEESPYEENERNETRHEESDGEDNSHQQKNGYHCQSQPAEAER